MPHQKCFGRALAATELQIAWSVFCARPPAVPGKCDAPCWSPSFRTNTMLTQLHAPPGDHNTTHATHMQRRDRGAKLGNGPRDPGPQTRTGPRHRKTVQLQPVYSHHRGTAGILAGTRKISCRAPRRHGTANCLQRLSCTAPAGLAPKLDTPTCLILGVPKKSAHISL